MVTVEGFCDEMKVSLGLYSGFPSSTFSIFPSSERDLVREITRICPQTSQAYSIIIAHLPAHYHHPNPTYPLRPGYVLLHS